MESSREITFVPQVQESTEEERTAAFEILKEIADYFGKVGGGSESVFVDPCFNATVTAEERRRALETLERISGELLLFLEIVVRERILF